jgi:hypothetical protein
VGEAEEEGAADEDGMSADVESTDEEDAEVVVWVVVVAMVVVVVVVDDEADDETVVEDEADDDEELVKARDALPMTTERTSAEIGPLPRIGPVV